MPLPQQLHPSLKRLTIKLIDAEFYSYAASICDLLIVCTTDRWDQISSEEQLLYIKQFTQIFHPRALGDTAFRSDEDFQNCDEILYHLEKGLERIQ